MRRRAKEEQVADPGPLVIDSQGRPVGVHVAVASAVDDSRHARLLRRRESLRRTHELDGQYRVRCTPTMFCSNPPR
jgi:hypothetical protein